jgi:hypothetical protein
LGAQQAEPVISRVQYRQALTRRNAGLKEDSPQKNRKIPRAGCLQEIVSKDVESGALTANRS